MKSPLFRKEVAAAQADRIFGEVQIDQPVSAQAWLRGFFVLTALFVVFLCVSHYSRKERFLGYLTPEAGLINIHLEQPGTVTEVFVRDGQYVKRGEPLVAVGSDNSLESRSDVNQFLIQSLELQQQNLRQQLEVAREASANKQRSLAANIAFIKSQIAFEKRRQESHAKRLKHAEDRFLAVKNLGDRAPLSADAISRLNDEYLSEKLMADQISQTILSLEKSQEDTRYQVEQSRIEGLDQENTISSQIAQLTQQLLVQKVQLKSIVTAPIDGKVTSLQAAVGGMFTSQQTVLTLLPKDSSLVAEIFIPSRAIGFLQVGQEVDIRYDAFPHEKYGSSSGRLLTISRTVLLPSQIVDPVMVNEPVYKATIRLDNAFMAADGAQFDLQAGMNLQADIALDRRPLIEWIFRPIVDVIRRL
jgi:membrane fusion protein